MRVILPGCVSLASPGGLRSPFSGLPTDTPTHTLTLRWQRLVDAADKTCPRCASTEQEVQKAFNHLTVSLAPAGIRVALVRQNAGRGRLSPGAAGIEPHLDQRAPARGLARGARRHRVPAAASCGERSAARCRSAELDLRGDSGRPHRPRRIPGRRRGLAGRFRHAGLNGSCTDHWGPSIDHSPGGFIPWKEGRTQGLLGVAADRALSERKPRGVCRSSTAT